MILDIMIRTMLKIRCLKVCDAKMVIKVVVRIRNNNNMVVNKVSRQISIEWIAKVKFYLKGF